VLGNGNSQGGSGGEAPWLGLGLGNENSQGVQGASVRRLGLMAAWFKIRNCDTGDRLLPISNAEILTRGSIFCKIYCPISDFGQEFLQNLSFLSHYILN
jgi:hypothetical protein